MARALARRQGGLPLWEPDGGSIYPTTPRFARWGLNNGAIRRLTRYGPAAYFPGSSANAVATADDDPISFAAGEPYTLALLILWTENPGTEGVFRSGLSSNGNSLWMTSPGRLWGRHANVDSPASSAGPLLTTGWHTLVRVWDGQRVRQYVDGRRTNTVAVTATGSWSIYKWGWQFFGSQALHEAYVPLFGAAWDDALVARWSADPLGMLWPERDATFVTSGGVGPPTTARRPVVIIATA